MIEVFRTNVEEARDAEMLLDFIHEHFVDYRANFDLRDCDRILRIESRRGQVHPQSVRLLLSFHGFTAEVLPDEIPAKK